MSYCINPACQSPKNSSHASTCQLCGSNLLLDDRFRALKRIGHGGFGRTFLALDETTPLKQQCVIKQFFLQGLYPSTRHHEKASELFEQEAQRLDELSQHTQIPTLIAYVEQQGHQYLVQEYIEGLNLAEELKLHGPFSAAKIQQLLLNLLPVLHFIHSRQIIHRDIKPTNIIRRRGLQQLVLVDFGAARSVTGSALVRTGTIIGTAEYTSPEQVRGKATFASDLYSLGVTCLHLMTGMSPFDLFDSNDGRWIWQNFLTQKTMDPTLCQVLDKLVEPIPRHRFVTAYEALKSLNPLQARFLQVAVGGSPAIYQESIPPIQVSPSASLAVAQWVHSQTFKQPGSVTALALHPTEAYLVTGGPDGVIRVWERSTGQLVRQLTGHSDTISALTFSPDGSHVVSTSQDRLASVWHFQTGQPVVAFDHHHRSLNCVVVHPGGDLVMTGAADHRIKLWELHTGRLIHELKGHAGPVRSLALTSDAQLLASGSEDASIRLWNVATGQPHRSIAAFYPIFSVAIRGQILAGGGYDSSVKIWDLATGKLNCIFTDHANWVTAVDISPDGQVIVSGSDDYTIKLRYLQTRKLFCVLMEHPGRITQVTFGSSGKLLASACSDGLIKVWQQAS